MKKVSIAFSRFFVGLLFVFSGLIKANDPLGFAYKLQEYFDVFDIRFLDDYAVGIAIFICGLEMTLGILLLAGLYVKKVIWGFLGLILFFTFLTFHSAFYHVVTSCGCFGDAIPLTPWQSFGKDLILLAFILILVIYRDDIKPQIIGSLNQKIVLVLGSVLAFGIGIYTYRNLPFIDFLPYKVGANIPALMKAPEGAPQDEYEITYQLKNKKTGETQKLTDKEYLKKQIWKNADWEVVGEPESKLVKKGYEVKIKDLKITNEKGEDYTDYLLASPESRFIIVAHNLTETNEAALGSLVASAKKMADKLQFRTIILTSSSKHDVKAISKKLNITLDFYFADAVPLKSMVRSNPGILLLQNGYVINKWHYRNMPSVEELSSTYFGKK